MKNLTSVFLALVLALIATANAQFLPSTTSWEIYHERIASIVGGLPPAHPKYIRLAVSPDGQNLAYQGESANGEQALYLLRLTDKKPWNWKMLGTAATLGAIMPNMASEATFRGPNKYTDQIGSVVFLDPTGQFLVTNTHVIMGIVAKGTARGEYALYGHISYNLTDGTVTLLNCGAPLDIPQRDGSNSRTVVNPTKNVHHNQSQDQIFTGYFDHGVVSTTLNEKPSWKQVSIFGTAYADLWKRIFEVFPLGDTDLLIVTGGLYWHSLWQIKIATDEATMLVDSNSPILGQTTTGYVQKILADPSGHIFFQRQILQDWPYWNGTAPRDVNTVEYFDQKTSQMKTVLTDSAKQGLFNLRPVAVSASGGLIGGNYAMVGPNDFLDKVFHYNGEELTVVFGYMDRLFGRTLGYRLENGQIPGSVYQSVRDSDQTSISLSDAGSVFALVAFSNEQTNFQPVIVKLVKPKLASVKMDQTSISITGEHLTSEDIPGKVVLNGQLLECPALTTSGGNCPIPDWLTPGEHALAVRLRDANGKSLMTNTLVLRVAEIKKPQPVISNVIGAITPDIAPGDWLLIEGENFSTEEFFADPPTAQPIGSVIVKMFPETGTHWVLSINAVTPTAIGGLVPLGLPPGETSVTVKNKNGESAPFKINVKTRGVE